MSLKRERERETSKQREKWIKNDFLQNVIIERKKHIASTRLLQKYFFLFVSSFTFLYLSLSIRCACFLLFTFLSLLILNLSFTMYLKCYSFSFYSLIVFVCKNPLVSLLLLFMFLCSNYSNSGHTRDSNGGSKWC